MPICTDPFRVRALFTSFALLVAGLTVVGVATPTAQAAGPVTWTGANSGLWSDAGNWGGVVPASGDDLVFPAGAIRTTVTNDLAGGTSFGSLTVGGAGYAITGNPLALGGELSTTYASGSSTSDLALTLTGGSVRVAAGGTLSLGGAIAGAAGLVLDGGGTLELDSVANTYVGDTDVMAGTLQVDGAITSPVEVASGSTLAGSGTVNGAGIVTSAASTIGPGPAGGAGILTYGSTAGLSLSRSSTLKIDLDGTTVGSGYDQLRLSNPAAPFDPNGATLDIDLGFLPAVNTSFQIVSQAFASPITGRFDGISQFGSLVEGPVTFSVGYFNSGVILTVTNVVQPAATVVVADTSLSIGETSLVTFTFSEAVSGFDVSDLIVAHGTLSGLASSDGGLTWTATLTPSAGVSDSTNAITLNKAGVVFAGGYAGVGTTASNNYAVDTERPTATLVVADTNLTIGETSLVTITFSEAVSGFTTADLSVPHGTLSGLSSSDGGITWTATLTPSAAVNDSTNLITLDRSGVADSAGNAGQGLSESNNYAVATTRPTATLVVADTNLAIGETSLVTITFSEAVSGFTTADLSVPHGTLSGLSSSDGGITWTATLTPATGVSDATNVITLDMAGVSSLAGNAGVGTTASNNYAVDTERPTATLVVADTNLTIGETSLVTITFSEAVSGFTTADLSVPHGTLSGLSSSDGGITWTATLTPATGVSDATNVITLDMAGVDDAAGNAGAGTTDSNNYVVHTVPPVPVDDDAPVSKASGVELSSSRTWTIRYEASDGASESSSGIVGVDLFVRRPDGTTYEKVGTSTNRNGEFTYTGTIDGTYTFRTVATDRVGNVESPHVSRVHVVVLDTTAPSSHLAGPKRMNALTWTLPYEAVDATSGIASVALYVRAPDQAAYEKVGTSTARAGEFTYTGTVDGTYEFRTVATDRAGHVELQSRPIDVATRLDRDAPSLRPALRRKVLTLARGRLRAIALRYEVDEHVSVTFRIRRNGADVRTFRVKKGSNVVKQLWRGRNDAGALVRPGRYRLRVVARDAAGNESRDSVSLRVRR